MPRSRPPAQLDIPLVWDVERTPGTPAPAPARPRPAAPASSPRLVLAALSDLGACALAVGVAVLTASAAGAVDALSLLLAAAVGLEAASVAAVGTLWGWRGTPGMVLLGLGAARALPLGRAVGVWSAWLVLLPVLGVPLLVPLPGGRGLDRLSGSPVSCLPTRAGA